MSHESVRWGRAGVEGMRGADFAPVGVEPQYPPDLELEPHHLDLALTVDVAGHALDGLVTTTVRARRAGPRTLALNAVAFADVTAFDPDGRPLVAPYDGEVLRVTWDEPFAAGEERRVAVRYRVARPVTGLHFGGPTPETPDVPRFAATDNETERARHWLPCVDLPSVRCTLAWSIRADAALTALANGALVDQTDHDDGTRTTRWRLELPCPSYLTCFVVGDLVRCDHGTWHGRPVATFAPPPHTVEDLQRSFGATVDMLAWLEGRVGMELPFPKYFQFALPGIGGAMENISLVSWDDRFVLDAAQHPERGWLVDLVNVHEMSHSFFGDLVVCRDFAHAWLKESWATYMEQVWLEDVLGADEATYLFWDHAHAYFDEAANRYKRPIVTRAFASSWDMYDRHLYPGGACRLHTLRCELGDDTFWAAVRDYVATYVGRVVETDDLRHVMEKHSGRSLGRFFDQWFHAPGHPVLEVTFAWDAERREGRFTVVQLQRDEKASVPLFDLRLELGWTLGGEARVQAVRVDRERQIFVVPMDADPEQVRVDPGAKVLLELKLDPGEARARRQLREAPDVIGRILAARVLVQSGRPAGAQAVAEAWAAEPFWGVRVEMARALGKSGTEAAIRALETLVRGERDPLVLEPLMRAAGQVRDAGIRAALLDRLAEGLPPRAAAAAWESLGAQREDAPVDALLEAAATPGPGDMAQAGALKGLAESRSDRALQALLDASRPAAVPTRVRPSAATGLGSLGSVLQDAPRERASERLVDLLRDPVQAVRSAAAAALGAMRATAAAPALDVYARGLAHQDRVRTERLAEGLRAAESPQVAGLQKQVEELRERLKKLEATLVVVEARVQPPIPPPSAD